MHKWKKRIISPLRFTLVILAIIAICVALSITLLKADTECHTITVTVEQGDTLWNLAQKYNNTDLEIREYIYEVCQQNHITPALHPGQEILLPVL